MTFGIKLFLLFFAVTVVCESGVAGGSAQFQQAANAQAQQFQKSASAQPSTAGSMNDSAKKSGSTFNMGAAINGVMAVGFGIQCATTTPTNQFACMMAATSAAQAATNMASAGGAGQSAGATNYGGGGNPYVPMTIPDLTPGVVDPPVNGPGIFGGNGRPTGTLEQKLSQVSGMLQKMGYKMSADNKSVVGPDGKSVPVSSLGSPDAMKSAGFSDSQIAAGMALANSMQAKLKNKLKGMSLDDSGGGGGGSGGRAGAQQANAFNFSDLLGKQKRAPASAAGLSKRYGNDSIGVQGDDIFRMITNQYQKKDSQNYFLKQ